MGTPNFSAQDGENLRLPGRFVLLRSRKRADGSRHLV